jgi:hypothetical protein
MCTNQMEFIFENTRSAVVFDTAYYYQTYKTFFGHTFHKIHRPEFAFRHLPWDLHDSSTSTSYHTYDMAFHSTLDE